VNEAKWLAADRPAPLLRFAWDAAGERRLRLFAVACCRRVDHLLTDRRFRTTVALAEQAADGLAGEATLANGLEVAVAAVRGMPMGQFRYSLAAGIVQALTSPPSYLRLHAGVADLAAGLAWRKVPTATREEQQYGGTVHGTIVRPADSTDPWWRKPRDEEQRWQAEAFRDIVGSPFHSVVVNPRWRTETAVALAIGIYADRAFDRLPILADALEEAGCDQQDVLAHCRDAGEHVRGCWVVDLVLGKG
jgi:hypothetical protein